MLHALLHLLVPLAVALAFYRPDWRRPFLLMLAGLLIDADHLLADPIYDPDRCSIGLHPFHTWPAMLVYAALLLPRKTRLIGIGLFIHIVLDGLDCL